MLMRYLGGGIGHKALRAIVKIADTLAALGHRGQPAKETAEEDMDVDVDVDVDLGKLYLPFISSAVIDQERFYHSGFGR